MDWIHILALLYFLLLTPLAFVGSLSLYLLAAALWPGEDTDRK